MLSFLFRSTDPDLETDNWHRNLLMSNGDQECLSSIIPYDSVTNSVTRAVSRPFSMSGGENGIRTLRALSDSLTYWF